MLVIDLFGIYEYCIAGKRNYCKEEEEDWKGVGQNEKNIFYLMFLKYIFVLIFIILFSGLFIR